MKVLKYKPSHRAIATPIRYLVVAMASALPIMVSQADVKNTQIGDLEIYQPAESGKVTVTMMLDTSGSMGIPAVSTAACDLPSGVTATTSSVNSNTTPVYTRNYCQTSSNVYFYKKDSAGKWYGCAGGSTDYAKCTTALTVTPDVSDPTFMSLSSGSNTFYYKTQFFDRMTRLKDAIFNLMDSSDLDSNKVSIGLAQFSSASDSNNKAFNGDGVSGKILVPAALLSSAQRQLIKTTAAGLVAYNGTPSANAYAEAGAYMMGTNTVAPVTLYPEKYINVGTNIYYPCSSTVGGPVCNSYTASIVTITNTTGYTLQKCGIYTGNQCLVTNTPTTSNTASVGWSGFNNSITTSKSGSNYVSPIAGSSAQCDGMGIYFLTDGSPNNNIKPSVMMKVALGTSGDSFDENALSTPTLPNGSDGATSGFPVMGEFAKRLRDTTLNPTGKSIRTAVVGFGSQFDTSAYTNFLQRLQKPKINSTTGLPVVPTEYQTDDNGAAVMGDFYDCTVIPTGSATIDARNTCQWAAKSHPDLPGVGGYGEGGFTSAQSTADVISSVKKFVGDLNNNLPSTPSGTIVVPDDPYRADSQLAIAYYPTLMASVSKNPAIWGGNVKKYNLNEGTLYGSNSQPLFLNVAGTLNPATPDLWSTNDVTGANNTVSAGGYSSQLPLPTSTALTPTRTLWLEDFTSTTDQTPKLRKFSINSSGKPTLDGAVFSSSNTFNDTTTYGASTTALSGATAQRALLNFLGYTTFDTTKTLVSLVLTAPAAPSRIVGATFHSTPVAVSYSAALDTNGKVTNTRDDYALFGSSDGALHLVNADDATSPNGGKELFAFIPKTILTSQPNALISGGTATNIDQPYAGMDAPWVVAADYKYDFSNNRVTVDTDTGKGVFAYGGLRMGGTNLYGMNITNHDAPTIMFDITPSTTGFTRMGQIWSQPTKTKMKLTASDTTGTDVLIFGGGYDTCYENQNFQIGVAATTANAISAACAAKTQAQGNAVYIVNAKTGSLIWSASGDSSANTVVTSMKNSVVGGVTALDRNNDGITDNIYFADLGGQVFRADFTNGVATAGTARVTRVLKNTYEGTSTPQYAMRFYERPVVSFYRNPTTNTLFAMVNVISGDRSSPLSTLRTNTAYADRLYGIIDSDITKPDAVFYASNFTDTTNTAGQKVVDLTDSNLSALPTAIASGNSFTAAQKTAAIATMQSGSSRGWYYPLTRFDGYANVPNSKGVGKSAVVGSYLYTTVYNPSMNYGNTDSCSAKVAGGSERELYCLPYGICTDTSSPTGTGGYARAGQGIQELTLGPRSSSLTNQRLLIGTQTLTQRLANRQDFNDDSAKLLAGDTGSGGTGLGLTGLSKSGGDGSAAEIIFNERYALTPNTWFEANR